METHYGVYGVSEIVFPIKEPAVDKSEKLSIKDKMFKRFKHWTDETTSHGIGPIIRRKRMYAKVLWLAFTLVSIGLCIYMLHRTINEYLQFEVTTKIRKEIQDDVPFPVISICNANPMATPKASEYIRDHFNEKFNLNVTTFKELLKEMKQINETTYNDEIYWLIYQTFDSNFDDTLRKSFGYSAQNMIGWSTLYGIDLDSSRDYEWYYNYNFGNCFRFNNKPTEDNTYYTEYLTNNGLIINLFQGYPENIVEYFYQPFSKGFYLLIEDQNSFPILKEGILIHPGTYTKISYSRVHTETESAPYSDCVDADKVDTIMSREMKKIGIKYTRRNCLDLLMVKIAMDEIGCYDQRLPQIFNATPCSSYADYQKISTYMYGFNDYFQYCPFECESIDFDLSISTQEFPSLNFYNEITQDPQVASVFNTLARYKSSWAYLYIEIADLRVTHISESPSVTLPDLLSNLGGTLGLFIGVSILSLVEFIELFIQMFAIFFGTILRRTLKK